VASTCPAFTQAPGSTSTRVIMPPSPATPTGISRRAASVPVAWISRSTVERPGAMTETVGSCSTGLAVAALCPRPNTAQAATATSSTTTIAITQRRRLRPWVTSGPASRSCAIVPVS